MKRSSHKTVLGGLLLNLAACLGLIFILTASECRNETVFVAAKQEICGDGVDNDDNGKIDCADSYCTSSCALELTVSPTFVTAADSQLVSGTQKHAKQVLVEVLPNYENNGPATLTNSGWSYMARKLAGGTNTLTITATDSSGNSKQVTTTLQVSNTAR